MFIKLREKKAFTLVEIMIVVAIIGLLVAIAIPNFVKARATTRTNVCKNNLRIIDSAKEQLAMDENIADAVVLNAAQLVLLDTYIKGTTAKLICPNGGSTFANSYSINAVGTPATCLKYDAAKHPAS